MAIITVDHIGKTYRLGQTQPYVALRDKLGAVFHPQQWFQPAAVQEKFWALRDISFSVDQGDVVGIIGRNGAGKSTLLKILSRITPPTAGKITLHGRVASLLEVGTGFHPELTGRENIFLNGAILGMTKTEIRKKFDAIVDFAEVEKFLDTPVKHYSSGMYVRLAFAVAAHLEPEILIVDEVLAVGDIQFQKKCLGKMTEVSQQDGRTVLFVSHNMAAVSLLCNKAVLLEQGKITAEGPTKVCLDKYTKSLEYRSGSFIDHQVIEDTTLRVSAGTVNGVDSDTVQISATTDPIELSLTLDVKHACRVSLETQLKDNQGNTLGICAPGHSEGGEHIFSLAAGQHTLTAKIMLPKLHRGTYFLEPRLTDPGIRGYITFPTAIQLQVAGYITTTGNVFDASLAGTGFQILDGSVSIV